jgi:hypothetical protein
MKEYKYIGVIRPAVPGNRFATSVFTDEVTDRYFYQLEKDGKIASFTEIKVNADKLLKANVELSASAGSDFVYSFITANDELYFGSRTTIANGLMKLLANVELNVHTKLVLSSFLKLFGKAVSYMRQSADELAGRGIIVNSDPKSIFESSVFQSTNIDHLAPAMVEEYWRCKGINDGIEPDDILFITEDRAYFKSMFFQIDKVINTRALQYKEYEKLISRSIAKCTKEKWVGIEDLVNKSEEVYSFILHSKSLVLDQRQIERYLTQDEPSDEGSILDVSLNFDKKIYQERQLPDEMEITEQEGDEIPRSKEALEHSIEKIIQAVSNQ